MPLVDPPEDDAAITITDESQPTVEIPGDDCFRRTDRNARRDSTGVDAESLAAALQLADVEWREVGRDLMLTARVVGD